MSGDVLMVVLQMKQTYEHFSRWRSTGAADKVDNCNRFLGIFVKSNDSNVCIAQTKFNNLNYATKCNCSMSKKLKQSRLFMMTHL